MSVEPPVPWPYAVHAFTEWFDELSDAGVFLTDRDLRLQGWNRWLETHSGRRAAEVNGRLLFDVYPELVTRGLDQFFRDALAGEARVVAYRFHRYLLPLARRAERGEVAGDDLMAQTARIAPLLAEGRIVGTITAIDNVTERVNTERELRSRIEALERARATAEAAVRTKDEFLATLSHELRTPLNAVLGWTRLMRSGQMDAATVKRALEVVDRNATAQAQLIDDILDVARIMQGKLRLDMQPIDFVAVVLAAVDVIRPAADAKQIVLTADVHPDDAHVVGDPNRLQQVVWNILSNALKFTPAGGSITMRVETRDEWAVLTVQDSGKGIAPEFLPFVFDRFRQEDSTTTRTFGGLGLGLSLVRQIVDLHGGRVEAASGGEGGGSRFTVALPLRAPALPLAHAPTAGSELTNLSLSGLIVLIVEDEPDTLDLLCAALQGHGARVVAATSAAEALQALAGARPGERPNVIVADIGLPAEDGCTLMRRVRTLLPTAGGDICAIAVTGYAGPAERERSFAAGFDAHFTKPVDPAELAAAVADLVAKKAGR